MEKLLKAIDKNPKKFLEKLDETKLEKILVYASDKYYNDDPVLSDDVYDLLEDKLRELNPKNKILSKTGAPVRGDIEKVRLPVWLGSLDKIKPDTRKLEIWLEKYTGPYVISDKLDGISGLLVYKKSGKLSIYTRGDGEIGQDISFLGDYLKLPKLKQDICIRGEFVMKKKTFEKKYAEVTFPKARTAVNSVVNSKKPDIRIIKDIDFVGYEIVKKNGDKWSSQFQKMKELGFTAATYKIEKSLNQKKLISLLMSMKQSSPYEIDGIVVSDDEEYLRYTSGRPNYSVAFKVNNEGIETVIEDIEWNPSKFGVLVPRITIKPVVIDGDTVRHTSGKNAKFVEENGLGKGAVVKVIKSGDVIPEIVEVIKKVKPNFPTDVKYRWNDTHVDILLNENKVNDEIQIKRLLHVFHALDVPGVSIGLVTKFYEGGYTKFSDFVNITIDDIMELPGFQEKSATKIYRAINDTLDQEFPLETVMKASLIFGNGYGEKKLRLVIETYPNLLENPKIITLENLNKVEGFSDKSSQGFLEHFPQFLKFLKENPYYKIKKFETKKGKLSGKTFVFTGFRDAKLKDQIESLGGKVLDSVSAKTDLLVYGKPEDLDKSKGAKAKKLGIKTVIRDEFKI
jgi:DNA ligase (NAD+)